MVFNGKKQDMDDIPPEKESLFTSFSSGTRYSVSGPEIQAGLFEPCTENGRIVLSGTGLV